MAMEETQRLAKAKGKGKVDWSRYVTGGLVGLLAAVLVYQGVGEARRSVLVKIGAQAPAVMGPTLQGQPFDLGALRGKAVIVDFFASWCEPCKKELPSLVALAKEHRERGVVLVMANRASEDRPEDVERYVQELMPDHPDNVLVVLADDETADQYRVEAIPTTYFIGRDGKIVERFRSLTAEPILREALEDALKD